MSLSAVWNSIEHEKKYRARDAAVASAAGNGASLQRTDLADTLKALLSHPNVASKEVIIRQYDHEVQGGSVIKPLMGVEHDAPTDAAVFRPKLDSWRGVAVSNGMAPEIGKWDPYLMAKIAVDEAYRNLIA